MKTSLTIIAVVLAAILGVGSYFIAQQQREKALLAQQQKEREALAVRQELLYAREKAAWARFESAVKSSNTKAQADIEKEIWQYRKEREANCDKIPNSDRGDFFCKTDIDLGAQLAGF